jgi:uncharacterized SAM-binding protein YcdF (DUF218 family)
VSFVAHQVLGVLARPLTDLVLLTLLALLARRRWLRLCCAAAWLAVLVLPVQQWAAAPLENRFVRPSPPAHVDGVVVLGGATNPIIAAERGIPALNGTAERMTEMASLARRYPDAKILFTGGYATLLPKSLSGGLTEADVAQRLMEQLGVPPERLLYEARARDTWENAVFSKALAHPAAGEVWLLVTSAIHMPRAVAVFRAAGWDIVPYPVAYETPNRFWLAALASLADKDRVLEDAGHEWAGLLTYRLEGRTRTLLPAP